MAANFKNLPPFFLPCSYWFNPVSKCNVKFWCTEISFSGGSNCKSYGFFLSAFDIIFINI